MDLKNALSVCLISLFSATLVVLFARSLDSQAASRLQPELARIASELEAIRTSGGIAATSATASPDTLLRDGLLVYYFHGNQRCPTCRAIERNRTTPCRLISQPNWHVENWSGRPSIMNSQQVWRWPSGSTSRRRLSCWRGWRMGKWRSGSGSTRCGDWWATSRHLRRTFATKFAVCSRHRRRATRPAPPQDVSDIPLPDEDGSDVPLPSESTPSELTEFPQPNVAAVSNLA